MKNKFKRSPSNENKNIQNICSSWCSLKISNNIQGVYNFQVLNSRNFVFITCTVYGIWFLNLKFTKLLFKLCPLLLKQEKSATVALFLMPIFTTFA